MQAIACLLLSVIHFSVAKGMFSSPKEMFHISLIDLIVLFPDLSTPLFFFPLMAKDMNESQKAKPPFLKKKKKIRGILHYCIHNRTVMLGFK